MTPWIQNVSLKDIINGFHIEPGFNSMLIQIVDPNMNFPTHKYEFKEVHQFKFLDLEKADDAPDDLKITDDKAEAIVNLLRHALENNMNVVVHCVAGVCRSGATAEVGVMMGFRDAGAFRIPNLLVKHKLMKALGWVYDDDEVLPSTPSGIILPTGSIKN